MKIIKKIQNHHPEVLDLEKEEIFSIYDSGMEVKKLYKSFYLIERYQNDKNEKTFNTSVVFPHMNITKFYNDVYIIKKGLFGFKDIKDEEIDYLLKLFQYDKDSVKEKNKPVIEEIKEETQAEIKQEESINPQEEKEAEEPEEIKE